MTYEAIKKILDKYDINTIEQLEERLSYYDKDIESFIDECKDDPEYSKKNCMNAKCYEEYGVPDCRKIVEIYNKYFKIDISKKDLFIDYLDENTSKSKSSIANYMSCKSCNQQIKKGIHNSLKIPDSDFKKDFCNNLSIKFDYHSIFTMEYQSIKQFLNVEHQITSETFIPIYNKENNMRKEEEKKLFDMVHTSKDKFKSSLQNKENLEGSDKYIFNLANYAFDRGLIDECEKLLNIIEKKPDKYVNIEEFIQLKAKVLSSKNKDKQAIEILKELINITKPKLDAETNNLLAASIKREAFDEWEKYNNENNLVKKLTEAKDIYYSIYNLNKDYYPALNYIYLTFMLAFINNEDKSYFKKLEEKAKNIWEDTNHKVTDWWSFISNIEFLIIIGQYEKAKQELEIHFNNLEKDEITEFNISSTLRQLKLFENFCDKKELKDIINFIDNIN